MFGVCAASNCPRPEVTVGAPTPVVPAAVKPCCYKAENGETCIAGIVTGFCATPRAKSINSIFRSSIPGASLITVVPNEFPELGAGAEPPQTPPPNMLLTIDPIINLSPFEYV